MKLCLECKKSFQAEVPKEPWSCPHCGFHPAILNDELAFAPSLAVHNDGFNPDFFSGLFQLEAGNFWYRARNNLILWLAKKYFPLAKNFLEVGCGTGFVLSGMEREFPQLSLSGTEIYTEGLVFAKQRLKRADLFQSDAKSLPYVNEFDFIGSFDVLEHIEEDEAVLQQFHHVLRENGGLLLTVPQHRFLWSDFDDASKHVRRYTRSELIQKLELNGFTVRRCGSFVSLLFPLMLLSRAKKMKSEKVEKLNDHYWEDLKLNVVLNWGLEKVMNFERLLIMLGIDFPFGGSIFVVAIKKNV